MSDSFQLLPTYNQGDAIDGIIRRDDLQNMRKAGVQMGSIGKKLSRDGDLSWRFPEQSSNHLLQDPLCGCGVAQRRW